MGKQNLSCLNTWSFLLQIKIPSVDKICQKQGINFIQ